MNLSLYPGTWAHPLCSGPWPPHPYSTPAPPHQTYSDFAPCQEKLLLDGQITFHPPLSLCQPLRPEFRWKFADLWKLGPRLNHRFLEWDDYSEFRPFRLGFSQFWINSLSLGGLWIFCQWWSFLPWILTFFGLVRCSWIGDGLIWNLCRRVWRLWLLLLWRPGTNPSYNA